MHLGGASSDPTRLAARQKEAYIWRARYQVQRKCYGALAAWIVRAADIGALWVRKLKMRFTGKSRTQAYQQASEVLLMLLKPLEA